VSHVFQMSRANVAKVDLGVSMLRMLIPQYNVPNVATICFRMLQLFIFKCCRCCNYFNIFDVANINFRCCGCCVSILQTCDVECCVEDEGRRALDIGSTPAAAVAGARGDPAASSWHVAIVRFHDAIISHLCCKSLHTCCICVLDMLQVFHANVSKLGLIFSMLQILIWMLQMMCLDVADMCCWVLQILNFNVADVEFQCCRYVMLGSCRGGREESS
jgi:hypothetical protein